MSDSVAGAALGKIALIVNEFRKLEPALPTQAVVAFLAIAQNEGCSTAEVGDALGTSQASASRNVTILCDEFHDRGKMRSGLGLVKSDIDIMNRRRRVLTLTPKGKLVVQTLVELVSRR